MGRFGTGPGNLAAAAVANLLVLGIFAYAAAVEATSSDFYYRSVQEDEYVEWAAFWSFLAAAVVFAVTARRQRRATGGLPWFPVGVALFCLFVALEEISWGQRVIGYRPPAYFLEHNYQLELNLHNVVDTDLRKLALGAVILGYGVLLPLLAAIPAVGRGLGRLTVVPPPAGLAPAFLATFAFYQWYPWASTGEWVEAALGLGFLLSALFGLRRFPAPGRSAFSSAHAALLVAAGGLLVVGLGVASAAATRHLRVGLPANVDAARLETEALALDFRDPRRMPRCGLHKRLYTYVAQYRQPFLTRGRFAGLTSQGLPESRAEFFLDPWNLPYWIRSRCSQARGRVSVFVYSFGPNRRRDSSRWEVRGDDVGTYVRKFEPR